MAYLGSVSYYLGQLARQLGQLTVAEQHLQTGLGMHDAIGARPLTAWTRLALAELAIHRQQPEKVVENGRRCLEIAEKLQMQSAVDSARALLH